MIILAVLLVIGPVILIIALFRHRGIDAAATIDIDQPQQQVFDYLSLLKNQEHYNAWLKADKKLDLTFVGTDGQPGFVMAWHGNVKSAGRAHQELKKITAPEKIEIELIFEKPVPSKAWYWLELNPLSDTQTRVTWRYKGNVRPYYLLRVSQLLFRLENRVRGYMQASLENVKAELEK